MYNVPLIESLRCLDDVHIITYIYTYSYLHTTHIPRVQKVSLVPLVPLVTLVYLDLMAPLDPLVNLVVPEGRDVQDQRDSLVLLGLMETG